MIREKRQFPDFSLQGKVALVTGANRGLDSWMALALAHAGVNVAVTYRHSSAEAEEITQSIRELGRSILAIQVDCGDVESIAAMGRAMEAESGSLAIMVSNAGVNISKKALEVTPEDFDHVIGVDLRGVFFCCQTAARMMIPRGGGIIINIASAAAFLVRRGITLSPTRAPRPAW